MSTNKICIGHNANTNRSKFLEEGILLQEGDFVSLLTFLTVGGQKSPFNGLFVGDHLREPVFVNDGYERNSGACPGPFLCAGLGPTASLCGL